MTAVLPRPIDSTVHSVWTTADELEFVQRLAEKRNAAALRQYLATARERTWDRSVNGAQVILAAENLLGRLEAELAAERLRGVVNGRMNGRAR